MPIIETANKRSQMHNQRKMWKFFYYVHDFKAMQNSLGILWKAEQKVVLNSGNALSLTGVLRAPFSGVAKENLAELTNSILIPLLPLFMA